LSRYYFTVASLPLLRLEEPPELTLERFLEMCEPWLSPSDYRMVLEARLDDPADGGTASQVLRQWRAWERALRNALVLIRAQRLDQDPFEHLTEAPYVFGVAALAQEALAAGNPLEAEETLLRARWSILEELESGHFFDADRLVVYSLKLQLLQRRALLEAERGRERFGSVFGTLKEKSAVGESAVGES